MPAREGTLRVAATVLSALSAGRRPAARTHGLGHAAFIFVGTVEGTNAFGVVVTANAYGHDLPRKSQRERAKLARKLERLQEDLDRIRRRRPSGLPRRDGACRTRALESKSWRPG